MSDTGSLGKSYQDGEVIIRQGEVGGDMYVIQSGRVVVLLEKDGKEVQLAIREEGDFLGEMALFDRDVRSATVRALGPVRVLTVDKKNLLRRIHDDPSLAFRIIEKMSRRIRELDVEVARLSSLAGESSPK
jgi:CRP/FNR family cyclic AMP-dependent transcriptional regulator